MKYYIQEGETDKMRGWTYHTGLGLVLDLNTFQSNYLITFIAFLGKADLAKKITIVPIAIDNIANPN